jgi:hypothetical protein
VGAVVVLDPAQEEGGVSMSSARNHIAWRLMNLAYHIATPWYGNMMVGSVCYGLNRAAENVRSNVVVYPSDRYRKEIIRSLLRDGEQFTDAKKTGP